MPAQSKRTLHVTKVTASEWAQETLNNGNTSMTRKFTVDGYDTKNNYHADCGELLVVSKESKTLMHTHCVQPESGEDYAVTFFTGSFSFDCEKCTDTDTEKYSIYTIRSEEERTQR